MTTEEMYVEFVRRIQAERQKRSVDDEDMKRIATATFIELCEAES